VALPNFQRVERSWGVEKGKLLANLTHEDGKTVSSSESFPPKFSPRGNFIASAANQVRIWSARDGASFAHFGAGYPAIDYANDGRYLVARPQQRNSNHTIDIFDIDKGVSLATNVTGNELATTPRCK
jgi:hypothetical protein